ncbi:MAG: hypothetical protein BGO34_16945 [Bacteroidia bacterium 44-10]|nr:MAG: hypothetical protein BGO34_16945 [Bacteroidia bacterium 44-10]
MKKKSFRKEQRERRERLDEIADQMAGYLNQAQKKTGDYHQVLKLVNDPELILQQFDEKLRRIAGMLYICNRIEISGVYHHLQ